ncbi:hypothetical protein [Gordonia aichiensis]|uniref:hypothetical protein n=1 Tax=Gordonia aichiensis TaxID=36820 RepID=UPI003267C652
MRESIPQREGIWTTIVIVAALATALLPALAQAQPRGGDLDFSRYRAVNAEPYRSSAYVDRGRHYFVSGGWLCQIGPQPGAAACRGKPATAPPGVIGVALAGEQQGPYWVRPGTTFQLGPVSRFRAPVLPAGTRITVADVTCAVPQTGVVACRNWNRGFRVSRASHWFLYPRGDRAHDGNPKARG